MAMQTGLLAVVLVFLVRRFSVKEFSTKGYFSMVNHFQVMVGEIVCLDTHFLMKFVDPVLAVVASTAFAYCQVETDRSFAHDFGFFGVFDSN